MEDNGNNRVATNVAGSICRQGYGYLRCMASADNLSKREDLSAGGSFRVQVNLLFVVLFMGIGKITRVSLLLTGVMCAVFRCVNGWICENVR